MSGHARDRLRRLTAGESSRGCTWGGSPSSSACCFWAGAPAAACASPSRTPGRPPMSRSRCASRSGTGSARRTARKRRKRLCTDCSGLVVDIYAKLFGITLPRRVIDIAGCGTEVDLARSARRGPGLLSHLAQDVPCRDLPERRRVRAHLEQPRRDAIAVLRAILGEALLDRAEGHGMNARAIRALTLAQVVWIAMGLAAGPGESEPAARRRPASRTPPAPSLRDALAAIERGQVRETRGRRGERHEGHYLGCATTRSASRRASGRSRPRSRDVRALWTRERATRPGAIVGGITGGVAGAALGALLYALVTSLCDTGDCADYSSGENVIAGLAGALAGGLVGRACGRRDRCRDPALGRALSRGRECGRGFG